MEIPKKDNRQALLNSPDWERALKNMSALYFLFTYTNNLAEETSNILAKYGFTLGIMKHQVKVLLRAFDDYDKTYRQLMEEGMMGYGLGRLG